MGDPLEVLLHGRLAAILDTGPSALSSNESVQFTPYIARLSAAWEREPSLAALYLWLDACLPENGARRAFEERATALKLDLGLPVTVSPPVDLVWANTDAEFPGAVSFQRSNAPGPDPRESGYVRLSSEEIAVRLEEASRRAAPHPKGQPRTFPERRSSLSGSREEKIGLTLARDGTWQAATGNALNTWIAKHEHNRKLPGEAGIEAICQRTLANLGLPAARTLSHVFAGEQAVLSERADRHADPATRSIRPRHQEEFCQATAWPGALKYDQGRAAEPRWEHAYTLLRNHAPDPDPRPNEPHRHPRSNLGARARRPAPAQPRFHAQRPRRTFRNRHRPDVRRLKRRRHRAHHLLPTRHRHRATANAKRRGARPMARTRPALRVGPNRHDRHRERLPRTSSRRFRKRTAPSPRRGREYRTGSRRSPRPTNSTSTPRNAPGSGPGISGASNDETRVG